MKNIHINTKNIGKILRKEYEFFGNIKDYCKNIFEESNNKKYNNINDIENYTYFNNDFINKLIPHIDGFNKLIAEVFTTSNNTSLRQNIKKVWRGGSNHKHKKYTKKRNPNKKYTISKKFKNGRLNKTRNRNIRNKNKTRINKYI